MKEHQGNEARWVRVTGEVYTGSEFQKEERAKAMVAEIFPKLMTGSKPRIRAFQRTASRMKKNNSLKAPPKQNKQ